MTAAAAVVICHCGHAERMHERDDDAEGGRGACGLAHCGCTDMRAAEQVDSSIGDVPITATAAPTETAPFEVFDRVAARRAGGPYPCPEPGCAATFPTKQGLGGHRSRAHRKLPEAAKEGGPSQRGSSAAASSLTPDQDARLASSGTATTEKDGGVGGDAPTGTAGPEQRRVASYGADIHLVLAGDAGTVDLQIRDAGLVDFMSFIGHVLNFVQPSEGATA